MVDYSDAFNRISADKNYITLKHICINLSYKGSISVSADKNYITLKPIWKVIKISTGISADKNYITLKH